MDGARHGFWTWLCPGSEFLEYLLGHEWGLQGDQFVGYVVCGMLFSRVAKVSSRKGFTSFWLEKASEYFFFTLSGKVGPPLKFQCYFHQCCPRGLYNALHHHLVFHGLNNPIIDRSSLPKYLRLATFLEVAPQAVDFGFFLPGRPLGTFTGSSYPMPLPKER